MEDYKPVEQVRISLGSGSAVFRLVPNDDVFYRVLSEECGCEIKNESELIASLKDFVLAKRHMTALRAHSRRRRKRVTALFRRR